KFVALLPSASNAVTRTGGVMGLPAVVGLGCVVKASWVAGPGTTSNAALRTVDRLDAAADSVYPVAARSIARSEKVATPFTAVTVAVPESVPPAGFVPIASVT